MCRKPFSAARSPSSPSAIQGPIPPAAFVKTQRCPARFGAGGRAPIPPPARNNHCGHRHERQDFRCRFRAADLGRAWRQKAASLGTLGIVSPSGPVAGSLTTPDPVSLHKTLDELARGGVTHLALEASSHGILQRRLDGVRFTAAAFTNLSRDHLDYHATLEDYLEAKLELFERLLEPGQAAIVDADSDVAAKVITACERRGLRVLTTGTKALPFVFSTQRRRIFRRGSPLPMRARISRSFSLSLGHFKPRTRSLPPLFALRRAARPRRSFRHSKSLMARLAVSNLPGAEMGAPVFVDYAHKPDALEKALKALRPFVSRPAHRGLWLRRRPRCGQKADHGGDCGASGGPCHRYRRQSPLGGSQPRSARRSCVAPQARHHVEEIGDRALAIARAIAMLAPDDGLLIAGKGHETGQTAGGKTLPFSDAGCARAILNADLRMSTGGRKRFFVDGPRARRSARGPGLRPSSARRRHRDLH